MSLDSAYLKKKKKLISVKVRFPDSLETLQVMTLQGLNSHKFITGLNLVSDDPFLRAEALQFAMVSTCLLLFSWVSAWGHLILNLLLASWCQISKVSPKFPLPWEDCLRTGK